jgi:Killing trait
MPEVTNAQAVDSMLVANEAVIGVSESESQGLMNESSAYSMALLMMNAASTQYAASQTANASVVTTCVEILKAGAKALSGGG